MEMLQNALNTLGSNKGQRDAEQQDPSKAGAKNTQNTKDKIDSQIK